MKKYDYMMKVASQALADANISLGNGETDWKKIYADMEQDEATYMHDVDYMMGDDFRDLGDENNFKGDGRGNGV
jgi:hypothetical protein